MPNYIARLNTITEVHDIKVFNVFILNHFVVSREINDYRVFLESLYLKSLEIHNYLRSSRQLLKSQGVCAVSTVNLSVFLKMQ